MAAKSNGPGSRWNNLRIYTLNVLAKCARALRLYAYVYVWSDGIYVSKKKNEWISHKWFTRYLAK